MIEVIAYLIFASGASWTWASAVPSVNGSAITNDEIETRITAHGIDFSLFEDRNRQYTEGKTVVGLMDDFLGRTPTFPGYFMIPNKAVQEEYSGSYKLRAVFARNSIKEPLDKGTRLTYVTAQNQHEAKTLKFFILDVFSTVFFIRDVANHISLDSARLYEGDILPAGPAAVGLRQAIAWALSFPPDQPIPNSIKKNFGPGRGVGRSSDIALRLIIYRRVPPTGGPYIWPTFGELGDYLTKLPNRLGVQGHARWEAFCGFLFIPNSQGFWSNGFIELARGLSEEPANGINNSSTNISNGVIPVATF